MTLVRATDFGIWRSHTLAAMGKRWWGSLPLGRKLWAADFTLSQLPDSVWTIYFQAMSVRILGKETHWYFCGLHAKISSGCEADSFRVIAGPWRCWLLLISHEDGLQGNTVRCTKCLVTLKTQNIVAKPKYLLFFSPK